MRDDDLFDDDTEEAFLEVPSFEGGGRVERTELALVHEGEYIGYAPPGHEHAMSMHFPVEIEVIGELTDSHKQAVADYLYEQLESVLRSRA
ncbi:MAG TPA: hypothetical protein VJT14_06650 [Candidatus Dormibacteraeota bacterium]|nr:hypothetical protein [Candidatus Dormibacteraeota bacterium]